MGEEKAMYTPAPWSAVPFVETMWIVDLHNLEICKVVETVDSRRETNARLIAAAPDLLKALIECTRYMDVSALRSKSCMAW